MPALLVACVLALVLFAFAPPARAPSVPSSAAQEPEEWFDADDAAVEDALADGDIDREDLARRIFSPRHDDEAGKRRGRGSNVFAGAWVSLVGLTGELPTGIHETAGFVVVGLALDRIVQGRSSLDDDRRRRSAFAEDTTARPTPSASPPAGASSRLAIDAPLARAAVKAAWRVSGIGASDAKIDDMIARSRLSVLLPETRIRAMQVFQDGEHSTSYINESGTVVDTSGSTTTLEARLTWRFDRLLFAGDEPTLERVRLEREEARNRIGAHVLELLFAWQRALLDVAATDAGSRAEMDATLRAYEAELSLDVLTGGWFASQPAVRSRHPRP